MSKCDTSQKHPRKYFGNLQLPATAGLPISIATRPFWYRDQLRPVVWVRTGSTFWVAPEDLGDFTGHDWFKPQDVRKA